ncbi:hypothetical protein GF359_05990 [candidate division WOR-3 bacterium]|uniref:T9SS type A sorting domain-containing protein n=1 Tax=candidate division WOR-3 bacterium TaxID=2052148 RepID=A0A9D5K9R4_UNCW3|nr:hypothetical protein [candidate division WOR-3 bacterium]MBD3364749.1 hypothetical protein [candidate division WOR-3 bacterium]
MKAKPIYIILIIALLVPLITRAGWMRTYGGTGKDVGRFVKELSDGSFIVLGETQSYGAGKTDIWLLKVNPEGDTVWSRTYGGSDYDAAFSIQPITDTGFIILGGTESIDTGGVWLIRISSVGDIIWDRTYGGHYDSYHSLLLKVNEDQGITFSDLKSLMRVNSAGDIVLTKTCQECWGEYYEIDCVNSTSDEGFILYSVNGSPNELIKVDEDGELVRILSEFNPQVNLVNYIAEGAQGYLYVGPSWGPGSDTTPNFNLFCAEVDSTFGYWLWTVDYGQPATFEDGFCVNHTADGGCIVAGFPYTLLKVYAHFDNAWISWTREYGGTPKYVEQTSDGGYILVGEKDGNLFLIKTDSLGLLGVKEPVTHPVTHLSELSVTSLVGRQINLKYSHYPQGFHAAVFDAAGRKVNELHSTQTSGVITWSREETGVYFIRPTLSQGSSQKVVIVR